MGSFRSLAIAVLGGVIGTGTIAGLLVGCSGDDTGADAGLAMDAKADQSPDVTTGREAGVDAGDADATVAAEAGPDVTSDVNTPDVADAADEGQTDAPMGPNPLQVYANQHSQAFCYGVGHCCPGYDAGNFDPAHCEGQWYTAGWENTLPWTTTAYVAGHLTFNSTQAAACLAALRAYPCGPSNLVTPAQYSAITNACLGVFTGTIPNGSGGCVSSFECANGYCNLPGDGGTGICTALVGEAGACAPRADSPDDMCSQAGKYQPKLWCDLLNHPDGGGATCVPPLPDGGTCYTGNTYDTYSCGSLLCGDNFACGSTRTYPRGNFCNFYIPVDAGGGG
jgi:hypothetical protein